VLIGSEPRSRWLKGAVALDDSGFMLTGARVSHTLMFETTSTGVFAVRDVRSSSVKRVASAVGDGAIARAWSMSTSSGPAEDDGVGVRSDG
jgi:thioredoxin reductase (NADPH)